MQRIRPPLTDDPKELRRFFRNVVDEINTKEASYQADSTAATVADLKDDFNALLAALQAAHLMDSS